MADAVERTPLARDVGRKVSFRDYFMVSLAAGLGYGFDAYAVNIYGIVLPVIAAGLGASAALMGLIGSIQLLGYTIGTIGFGIAADRFGRKDTLGASILLYGATTTLGGLVHSVPFFAAMRFLTGVGGAGELAVGAPYTAEMWPARFRAIGVGGIVFSLFSLGYILAGLAALYIVPRYGWEWTFIIAIIPAVAVFLMRLLIRESIRYVVERTGSGSPGRNQGRVWSILGVKKRIGIGWLLYVANAVGYWSLSLFLTTFMTKKFGLSPENAIKYAVAFYTLQFFFSYLGTGLSELIGRRPSGVLGACIMIGATIAAATAGSITTFAVFGGIMIAMLGWLWGLGDTYIAELFPTRVRGTCFGISVGGGRIASVFAPTLVGVGIDHFGPTIPFLATAALWVLTFVGYLLGPETSGKELEEIADGMNATT